MCASCNHGSVQNVPFKYGYRYLYTYIYILYIPYVYHISDFDEGICFERVEFPQPFIGTDSVPEVIDPFQIVPGRALGLTIKHRLFQVSTYPPLNVHPPEFPGLGVG